MRFFQYLHTHLNLERELTGNCDRISMVTSMGMLLLDAILKQSKKRMVVSGVGELRF